MHSPYGMHKDYVGELPCIVLMGCIRTMHGNSPTSKFQGMKLVGKSLPSCEHLSPSSFCEMPGLSTLT